MTNRPPPPTQQYPPPPPTQQQQQQQQLGFPPRPPQQMRPMYPPQPQPQQQPFQPPPMYPQPPPQQFQRPPFPQHPPPPIQQQQFRPPMQQLENRMQGMNLGNRPQMFSPATPPGPSPPTSAQFPSQLQQPQQPQQQRINPDAIPSPVIVHQDDQKQWDMKEFRTKSRDNPPLAISEYLSVDEGNASPRFMRLSTYTFPQTADLALKSCIPLGMVVQPFAELKSSENEIPVVDGMIIRCVRCKAYMNPEMKFTHGGQRFECNICKHSNDCPPEYYCQLDVNGRRLDADSRPELSLGIVDFKATEEFCLRKPRACHFAFLVDVSYSAVASGVLASVCQALGEMLDYFPTSNDLDGEESNCRLALITYDKSIHFYTSDCQCMIVSDVDDVFSPLPSEQIFMKPGECGEVLKQLPQIYATNQVNQCSMGAAVEAALKLFQNEGGRIVLINTQLPNHGPGTLKQRDQQVVGTDKERQLYQPQDQYHHKLSQKCVEQGVGVDLFLPIPSGLIDLATVGILSAVTGGQTYFYPQFRAEVDAHRFIQDLQRLIIRPFGYDSLLRVRCGDGLTVQEHFGNFHMKNLTDVEMAMVDSEKALGVIFKHDGQLASDYISFQVALLYTSATGQRLIRCLNLTIPTTNQMSQVFKSADMDTTMNILCKNAISQIVNYPLKSVRDLIGDKCVQILLAYRKYCATSSSHGQLILPESFKLYPLYSAAVLKTRAFTLAQVSPDLRVYEMRMLRDMPLSTTMIYFYPKLLCLHKLKSNECQFDPKINRFVLPESVRSSKDKLESNGAFLLVNALSIWLWLGRDVHPQFVVDLFQVQSQQQINPRLNKLPVLQTELNKRLRSLIAYFQDDLHKGAYPQLKICRQGVDDAPFLSLLVEDSNELGPGYVDYMCMIHKSIIDRIHD